MSLKQKIKHKILTTDREYTIHYLKLLVIIIWAGTYHICKYLVNQLSIYSVGFIRIFIASLTLLAILKYKTGKFYHKLTTEQWLVIAIAGFIGSYLYNIFLLLSEQLLPADTIALLWSLSPLITAVGAMVIFHIHFKKLGIIGLVIAFIGAIGMINYSSPNCTDFFCTSIITQNIHRGQILAIITTCSFSIFVLSNRVAIKMKVDPLLIATYAISISALFLGVTYGLEDNTHLHLSNFTLPVCLSFIYVSILSTAISYWWFIDAISFFGATKTVLLQNTTPILAVMIGTYFLNQSVHYPIMICRIIIIIGVLITQFSNTKKK